MIQQVRETYIALRLYFSPTIQEKGDGGMVTIRSSTMEGGLSILQQGYRQTDKNRSGKQK